MKILLVQPRSSIGQGLAEIANVEPYGLEMIAGSLCPENEVKIFDFVESSGFNDVLSDFKPDCCGISCSFTVDVYRTRAVAEIIKKWKENVPVFVGGHHATLNPGDFYDSNIDFVVLGEGEITVREAVHCIKERDQLEQVPGLALNHSDKQYFTGLRKLIPNLDHLPSPARHLTSEYRKRYFLGFRKPLAIIETARGCPYRCNFCSVWKFYRGKCRSMSADRAVAEIAAIKEDYVLIVDDNFLYNIKRAATIAEKIISDRIKKKITIQARSDTIVKYPHLVPLIKKAGINQIFIGFEKTSDDDLTGVNKQNSANNNEKALDLLRKEGIGVIASFIIEPRYNLDDFKKMIGYIKKLKIRYPAFSILTPFPGTDLYEEYKQKITVKNLEKYDLMHSVLPLKLPESLFYKEYRRLYRASYLNAGYLAGSLQSLIALLFKGELTLRYAGDLLSAGNKFIK